MSDWVKILLVVPSLFLIRAIINLSKWIQIKNYYKVYLEYLETPNPTFEFSKKTPQIIELFKDTGISSFGVTRLENVGVGKYKEINIDGFLNLTSREYEIVGQFKNIFHEAMGVYRHRTLQSLNPIFWIEFALKLPKYLMKYVGIKSENTVNVIQIIYWIIGIIVALKTLNILKVSDLIK